MAKEEEKKEEKEIKEPKAESEEKEAKEEKDSIIVFCAHPDDEIIGVGGTIAKYAEEGKQITTVIFTHGEMSQPWIKSKLTIEARISESNKAGDIVGCKEAIFLGLKEGKILDNAQELGTVDQLVKIIKDRKPIKIFTHSSDDPHPDHRAINKLVLEAVEKAKSKASVFSFDIWNFFSFRRKTEPKLVVDVTKTFSKKLHAMKMFVSQRIAMMSMTPAVYMRAVTNGWKNAVGRAEVFRQIK